MLLEEQKTELEKELINTKKENEILHERQRLTDLQLSQVMDLIKELEKRIKVDQNA